MSTIWVFDGIKIKRGVYTVKDYLKKFWESLKEHAMKITIFEQKKVLLSTNKGYISYHNKKTEIIVIIQINTELLYKAYAIYNMEHLKKQDLRGFSQCIKI